MDNSKKMLLGIVAVIVLLLIMNIFFLWGLQKTASPQPPAPTPIENKSELIAIVSNNCPKCVELAGLIDQLRQLDINFSERSIVFETDSEAKELVQKYGIQKLPGVVLKASPADFSLLSERWQVLGTVEDKNVLVLRELPPPFFDIASSTTKGLVEFWSISKTDCLDCTPAPKTISLAQLGLVFSKSNELNETDSEAQQLIERYSITKLPTVILSSEVKEYSRIASLLETGGDFSPDGTWVLRNPVPYYWDLNKNKKRGSLSLTRVTFADCNGCFALDQLEEFLVQNLSLKIASDQNLDWSTSEGKKFVSDYNISRIPTLVVSGEINAYKGLEEGWLSFGFVAANQQLVFAEHEKMGPEFKYFDVDKNQLAVPPEIPLGG